MNKSISEALHGVISSYRAALKSAAAKADIELPVTHIRALKCICNMADCSARDIAHRLSLDKSQIARLLKDLHTQGYIYKDQHPVNRRCQSLKLTDKGQALYNKIQSIDQQNRVKMCHGIADAELEQFIQLANRMKDNLNSNTQQGPLS